MNLSVRIRLCALLLIACCLTANPGFAQSPDEQQLKDKVQQLEQLTQELKARIAAIEKTQLATTQAPPSETTTTQGAPSQTQTATIQGPPKTTTTVIVQQPSEASEAGPTEEKAKKSMDIYGFAQIDTGYDFGQNDPNWFDVMRPTKLPSAPNEFGRDGRFYASVRQTRFGVKSTVPTDFGDLKTIFEFELFGTGVDAGQTTFRLRHAWGELGQFGAGQTWSPFMDPDVFPNSLEYWGPNGMVFFRNVQLRWMPINKGNKQLWFAAERPGASADLGQFSDRVQLQGVRGRFPAPDLSARARVGGERTYLQIAGIGRYIAWDDPNRAVVDLSGHTWGWGVNVSSNLGFGKKDVLRLSTTYGHGIENYMNDAPVDVAPKGTTNPLRPLGGDPLPVFGLVGFYDHNWSERWTSSVGYSMLQIENARTQLPNAFHRGRYGLVNLLFYPVKNVMTGGEFQWGRRDNNGDGFTFDDYRVQFSAKYNFDYKLGGGDVK
jgi:DcaP outer membrane protein